MSTMNRLLSIKETAKALGVSVSTIYRFLKHDPKFPKALRLTRKKTVFREEDVNKWIESLTHLGFNGKTRN